MRVKRVGKNHQSFEIETISEDTTDEWATVKKGESVDHGFDESWAKKAMGKYEWVEIRITVLSKGNSKKYFKNFRFQ